MDDVDDSAKGSSLIENAVDTRGKTDLGVITIEDKTNTETSSESLINNNKSENYKEKQTVDVVAATSDSGIKLTNKNKSDDDQESENKVNEPEANNSSIASSVSDGYDPKNVIYENGVAFYTDSVSGYKYQWVEDKQEWILQNNLQYGFEDDTHTYTDSDGVKYFWDKEKSAWFPKINDEFMAQYQMNYGFVDNTVQEKIEIKKPEPEKRIVKEAVKRKITEPTWFEVDEKQNTKVYVSNLPTDINEEEFVEFMQKCGLVMQDPSTGKKKIKLYTEPNSDVKKGDALCTYIRKESVDLALKLLDGADLKGHKVQVELAKFQMKGEYNPKLKPKTKKRKEKEKLKRMQEKLFDWRPEKFKGDRAKHERVVILKNVFESAMFDKDVGLILEFQQDLREECSKCGTVRKVVIYDRHPEGVAQITMSTPEEADECVRLLNERWFGKRQITAENWNGRTKFKIAETDSQISQRLEKWDKFLEEDDKKNDT